MNRDSQYLVLGAGISGLFAARALQERGVGYSLIESCPKAGGLTRTVNVDDFCFDYTGHLLHLSRYEAPSAIPFARLNDDDWQRVSRRSVCYMGGELVPAPVQYHLGDLPQPLRSACIDSYSRRPRASASDVTSFRDFVVQGFGQALSDAFLIPQNEKSLATSLEKLSKSAVKRFFPPPTEERVRLGMTPGQIAPPEYNSRFWYPKQGGIERLFAGVADSLTDLHLLQPVERIDLERRIVRTATGDDWPYEQMLTSLPLKRFCEMTNDAALARAAAALSHSSTVVFNLGIRGEIAGPLRDVHWIYVPDRDLPFYRVGIYSNMTSGMAPPGYTSMYVEVGVPSETLDDTDIATQLYPRVIDALAKLGWVNPSEIACCVTHLIRCAYVHHSHAHADATALIFDRLGGCGVHPIGRYGTWDYISMEDSIHSALETVERLFS